MVVGLGFSYPASAQSPRCDIPRAARDIWRCENGFVIGPENVIIRLPIPETDPEALYNAGIEAAGREDWRVAIAYFTAAHQRAHLVPRYMYNLGLAHARAGNEVPAIAWLAAYLTAEPNAPNRAEIWAQIAQLENEFRRKRETIFQGALSAVLALPNVPVDEHDRRGARSDAFQLLSQVELRGPYPDRANHYAFASNAALLPGNAPIPMPGVQAPPEEERDSWPCQGLYFSLGRLDYVCEQNPEEQARLGERALDAISQGDRARAQSLLRDWPDQDARSYWTSLELALNGRTSESQAHISELSRGFMGNLKEDQASRVGEALLLLGDVRGARRFAQFALQMAELERQQSRSERETESLISGILAERLRALVLAEEGDVAGGIEHLTVYTSRRLTTWSTINEAHSPEALWLRHESDARLAISAYLFDRGRYEAALSVARELNGFLQARLYGHFLARARELGRDDAIRIFTTAEAQLLRTAGGDGADALRRVQTEESVRVATGLPGACYDLNWWLTSVARGDFAGTGRWRGITSASPEPLMLALRGLDRGLHAVRIAYERTGATWGQ
ncbi:MAG: hypothetical protein NW206_10595 [Hyphomonadaceae bacterium]|nr:hypothetical protein [Hyphomonadaceae bacterium]